MLNYLNRLFRNKIKIKQNKDQYDKDNNADTKIYLGYAQ